MCYHPARDYRYGLFSYKRVRLFFGMGNVSNAARIAATSVALSAVEQAVMTYEIRTGNLPDSLDALLQSTGDYPDRREMKVLSDSWGNPIRYTITNETFVLRSAGTDGVMDTADDLLNQ